MKAHGKRLELWVFRHYRAVHVVKTTLACLFVLVLTAWLEWPHASWALITIAVVMAAMPQVGGSLQRVVLRGLGTLFGGLYAFTVLIWLPDTFVVKVAAILLGIGVGTWLATDRRLGYAGIVLALTVALMLGDAERLSAEEGLWRLVNVLLGGVTTALFTLTILPIKASRKLLLSLSSTLSELAELYLQSANPTLIDPHTVPQRLVTIQAQLNAQSSAIGPAIYESQRMRRFKVHYLQIVAIEQRLLSLVESIFHTHASDMEGQTLVTARYELHRVRWGYGTMMQTLARCIETDSQVDLHIFEDDLNRLHTMGHFYLEQSRDKRRLATSGYLWQHFLLAEQLLELGELVNEIHQELKPQP